MTKNATLAFETKVWEADYRIVLGAKRLEKMVVRNGVEFNVRRVLINNVDKPAIVAKICESRIREGLIDEYYFVDHYIEDALAAFAVDRDSLGTGYYYSNSELVGIYLNDTKYLLHYAGDVLLSARSRWVAPAMNVLESQRDVVVANPMWTRDRSAVLQEADGSDKDFGFGYGFSDQMYLVETARFKDRIYGFLHTDSERYPSYGGELFEKRVDSWMRINGLRRATWLHGWYTHNSIRPGIKSRIRYRLEDIRR